MPQHETIPAPAPTADPAPERVPFDPYARDGVVGRTMPFVVAIVFGLVLLPVQEVPVDVPLLLTSFAALFAVIGAAMTIGRFEAVPSWVPRLLPIAYLLSIAVLREATGGTTSGYGALLYLAPFWVALYDSRNQVFIVVAAMFCVQAGQGLIEANFEDITALRRALLAATVIGMISLAVQRNVSQLRRAEARLAKESRARARANDQLAATVDQLTELDHLKSRFVAMASHELRTPLASIAGFASTLQTRWDDIAESDRRRFIDIIDEQGKRLARLVDDLLVLSRIESGSLDARPELVELNRAVQTVIDGLDMDRVDVTVRVTSEVRVAADRDHLQQMLINYVSNAVKYGAAPIEVEARTDGEFIDVIVSDCGDGVPDDVAPILFEEFARARDHTDAGIQGTGLGLSIVRGLARAQGGEAWYEPNLPRGAQFCLRLPTQLPVETAV